jgi:hypothetical protein
MVTSLLLAMQSKSGCKSQPPADAHVGKSQGIVHQPVGPVKTPWATERRNWIRNMMLPARGRHQMTRLQEFGGQTGKVPSQLRLKGNFSSSLVVAGA